MLPLLHGLLEGVLYPIVGSGRALPPCPPPPLATQSDALTRSPPKTNIAPPQTHKTQCIEDNGDHPPACKAWADDYLECLHHRRYHERKLEVAQEERRQQQAAASGGGGHHH